MSVQATGRPAVPSIWSATHSSAWMETRTHWPSCTPRRLGHAVGCHLTSLQRLQTLLRNSLAQHLNPSLHKGVIPTSTAPSIPTSPTGAQQEPGWRAHPPWKGNWPAGASRQPHQALEKGDASTENDLFCQFTLFHSVCGTVTRVHDEFCLYIHRAPLPAIWRWSLPWGYTALQKLCFHTTINSSSPQLHLKKGTFFARAEHKTSSLHDYRPCDF